MDQLTQQLSDKFVKQWDNEIKAALSRAGFDKINYEDFSFIQQVGDPFEHLYYKYGTEDQKRIISVEKEVKLSFENNDDDFVNNTITVHADKRYY